MQDKLPGTPTPGTPTPGTPAPGAPPGLVVIAAACCLSLTGVLVKLAAVDAGTVAFLRCAIALLALGPLAVRECRRHGMLPRPLLGWAVLAGVFLGLDYAMYTAAILDAGAGVATVLNNVQVIVFPVLARVLSATPIRPRFLLACPIMLAGMALVGGAFAHDPQVTHQLRGTVLGLLSGAAYAGYLHLNRQSGRHSPRHLVTPVCAATGSAALVIGLLAPATTGIDLTLPGSAWLWITLLALIGQVAPFLLLASAIPRTAPNTAATLLLLQPVLAVVFGMLIVAEAPAPSQLLGCLVVVLAVWFANHSPRSAPVGQSG
ncbi:EamA family transporter [Saccharopolyspora sp. HNM0983]|uniref:EamA family transporter n=1 Tax=Saccharopolyspora montiporae TaxID=2781240 RepID=A0A929B8S2_9PSEU|nr:DMT family transporter [Saccharopolyspora sp. HNM0983]MBE9373648.1 EamA family transporter [Saccharopolyspora sp. HNM0983]